MYNHKEYVKKHREAQRSYAKMARKTEAYKARQARYLKNLRIKVLMHYGNKCACCGETEPMFLEIDHINNDGAQQRRGVSSNRFYFWLKRHNYPPDFQILCSNCNRGKWRNGGICPHKTK